MPLLTQLRYAAGIAGAGARTLARRAVKGPANPEWSLAYEALLRAMQAERARLESAEPDWQSMRVEGEAMVPRTPTVSRRSYSPVNASGIRGEHGAPALDVDASTGEFDPPVLLYIHGGGFTGGSLHTHRDLLARIGEAGNLHTLAIHYRLAPESAWPHALEDCVTAYRWLLERVGPAGIVVGGDSAGGNLALALLIRLRDERLPMPARAILLSPWVALDRSASTIDSGRDTDYCSRLFMERQSELYRGELPVDDPRISPLYADLRGLPPMLIQAGGGECLLDDSVRLHRRAQTAGVDATLEIYEAMPHVFQTLAVLLPKGRQAIESLARFTAG